MYTRTTIAFQPESIICTYIITFVGLSEVVMYKVLGGGHFSPPPNKMYVTTILVSFSLVISFPFTIRKSPCLILERKREKLWGNRCLPPRSRKRARLCADFAGFASGWKAGKRLVRLQLERFNPTRLCSSHRDPLFSSQLQAGIRDQGK